MMLSPLYIRHRSGIYRAIKRQHDSIQVYRERGGEAFYMNALFLFCIQTGFDLYVRRVLLREMGGATTTRASVVKNNMFY